MTPAVRCQRLARLCTGSVDRVVRLAEVREPVGLCEACITFTRDAGMDPKPIPEWLARGYTGENGIHDLTGQAAVRGVA